MLDLTHGLNLMKLLETRILPYSQAICFKGDCVHDEEQWCDLHAGALMVLSASGQPLPYRNDNIYLAGAVVPPAPESLSGGTWFDFTMNGPTGIKSSGSMKAKNATEVLTLVRDSGATLLTVYPSVGTDVYHLVEGSYTEQQKATANQSNDPIYFDNDGQRFGEPQFWPHQPDGSFIPTLELSAGTQLTRKAKGRHDHYKVRKTLYLIDLPDLPRQAPVEGWPANGFPSAIYASWGRRVGASLIDLLAPALLLGIALLPLIHDEQTIGKLLLVLISPIMLLNLCMLQGKTGQSIGKKIMGIIVVRDRTGRMLGTTASIVRQLAHIIDIYSGGLGYLLPLVYYKKQTFADRALRCVVIKKEFHPGFLS